jgi:hypothetical protein
MQGLRFAGAVLAGVLVIALGMASAIGFARPRVSEATASSSAPPATTAAARPPETLKPALIEPLEPIPPILRAAIEDGSMRCGVSPEAASLAHARVTLDGYAGGPAVLDWGRVRGCAALCGIDGCLLEVWLPDREGNLNRAWAEPVRRWSVDGDGKGLTIDRDGTRCGSEQVAPCPERLRLITGRLEVVGAP